MSYPSKSTSTYTAPSKNSSSSTLPTYSGQFQFLIDSSYFFLIDNVRRLLIDTSTPAWSYKAKS